MTNRARPRVHLLTGGPAWEVRRAMPEQPGFSKRQKEARKPLLQAMSQLSEAVKRRNWRAARAARAAAWDEVDKLIPDLTREERKMLWKYKQQIAAGESRDRLRSSRPDRSQN
ncbi:hypothetical protein BN159_0636 [Streptomyces davaonensis JCM 4913]|uniref:Uncharacterized protein n=1 Tax=Streptomyces davaonensis (strain DSM 101723 / JCM 4913 / KCC S-0913 / 768) TaxID=1214101 RepID=K4QW16_STRDJ|nr:hypothetical protein [Streptomyces davaonensis]CCK25015.1 hypothetical protein BN159_0636 [Streptomyces davaonensis JCM 4913]